MLQRRQAGREPMAHDYAPKLFLRQAKNALLREYFTARGELANIDWDSLKETDVAIAKHGNASIRITVTTTERLATSGYTDEDGNSTHRWEGAEREGSVERTYDLRTLGLADDRDRPNRAGQALLSVLSGKGTVKSKEKDKGMAELCGVLTRLMGITESPFDFTPLSEKWVAKFDAGGGS